MLMAIGFGIAAFVYRSTTQIKEALAEEILEQQRDVAGLVLEYNNVMISLERVRLNPTEQNQEIIKSSLNTAQQKLELMRSSYSFEQLDGAAEANAYVKPILEDIKQWTSEGIANQPGNSPFVLQAAAARMAERYNTVRTIASDTESVADELVSEQTDVLEEFRNWLLGLLAGFGLLSLSIMTLLIRQRNLQAQLAIDQEHNAMKLIDAETRGREQAEIALLGLEERDRRLRAELAHVSRLTTAGELASGLAHELNQPLTAITHNCDAVMSSVKADSQFDPEMLETVHDISEQAQRAGGIIRSMRQLVRKDTTDKVSTNINTLVKETVRLTAPEARERGVKVSLKLDENLPNPVIDPVQIQQVLVNLERNSVESMWQADSPRKQLTIETSFVDADFLQVSITDTGPGIDPTFAKSLFTAFQTTKAGGMGLGLSISRTIVEEHGGRLWIDPATEGVTIFRFTIPFTQE